MKFAASWGVALALAAQVQAQRANELIYPRQSTNTLTIDPAKTYQRMDGFGASFAFQRANLIVNMKDKTKQRELLDLLFNRTTGAGLSIIRNGIGSSPDSSSDHMNSFAPKNPGSPTAAPQYSFDGKDSGQLWISKVAQDEYGVNQIYGDAWSAPGYMKSNNNENNGGQLKAEWKQAFVNYLMAYVGFYKEAGVTVTHLGFLNEPDYTASYASMQMNGAQAADFTKLLYAAIVAANLTDTLGIVCCESMGWGNQVSMTNAIKSAGAESMIKAFASHTYQGGPGSGSMSTTRPVWLSEQCDLNGQWSTSWYGNGGAGDGYTWANNIMTAVTTNNIGGYLYWEAVQWPSPTTNEKMIRVDNSTSNYEVARRLWAFANFSRYVRPGAVRIGSTASGSGLKSAAFKNVDGSMAVVVLNTGAGNVNVAVKVNGVELGAETLFFVSDATKKCELTTATASGGTMSGSLSARALGTFVIPAPAS